MSLPSRHRAGDRPGFLVGKVVKKIGEHHIVPASLSLVAIGCDDPAHGRSRRCSCDA